MTAVFATNVMDYAKLVQANTIV